MATRTAKPSRPRRRAAPSRPKQPPRASLLRELGVLRVALVLMALAVMIGAPKPGTAPVLEGWGLWSTLLTPTLAPILFMVLMLDALMGRVMMTDTEGDVRARFRRIVTVNLVTGIALFLWWMPYFAALFAR
jgi:hypothetical protein